MARSTCRRTLRWESLESRELLSGPTAEQQYMLQLLNLVRTNPSVGAQRILSNLNTDTVNTLKFYNINLQQVQGIISSTPAQPPLAWSNQLGTAAQNHSQDMANTAVQSHTGSDGSSPQTRMDQAGYTNRATSGEDAYAYATSVDESMQAFLIDWGVADNGHRTNIIQPNVPNNQAYRDAGIGVVNSTKSGFGPKVVTVDFGSQNNEQAQLVGVVYNDPKHTEFYALGSGQGGVTISATNQSTGQVSTAVSQTAGGYQMPLAPGNYTVTATSDGKIVRSQNVTIGSVNVEADFNLNDPWQGGAPAAAPVVSLATRITPTITPSTPAPTPPPAPVTPAPVVITPPAPTTPPVVKVSYTQPTTPTPTNSSSSFIFALASNATWTSWTANNGS
jgi:uncharacterized protein YkwD